MAQAKTTRLYINRSHFGFRFSSQHPPCSLLALHCKRILTPSYIFAINAQDLQLTWSAQSQRATHVFINIRTWVITQFLFQTYATYVLADWQHTRPATNQGVTHVPLMFNRPYHPMYNKCPIDAETISSNMECICISEKIKLIY